MKIANIKSKSILLTAIVVGLTGVSSLYAQKVIESPVWPEKAPANWPTYHLVHPDPDAKFFPGDPNPALYYKGRYHLHYLYKSPEGGLAMAHVSSTDMVHWKWHPTVLRPKNIGSDSMLSGAAFFTKEGTPAIIFSDNHKVMIVYALDENLDSWSKPEIVEVKGEKIGVWDPDCWLNGETYYSVSSNSKDIRTIHLIKSKDLKNWRYVGDLMHDDFPNNLGVTANDDISCPNMFRIGDKWMLLCISHTLGCRYYLGDFKDEQYLPESHTLMNWQNIARGTSGRTLGFYFAPESLLTPDGRRVMWAWLFPDDHGTIPQGLQSLPRELALAEDGTLLIKPLTELKTLRSNEMSLTDFIIKKNIAYKLEQMSGDAIEFEVVFAPFKETPNQNINDHVPQSFGMQLLCDENGKNGVSVIINPSEKTLSIADISAPFDLPIDEQAVLRVFIDNNLIEVFANNRQAIAYAQKRTHPHANNQLCSNQGNMPVKKITAWKINSPWKTK